MLWLGLGLGLGLGFDPSSPIVRELVLSLTRLSFPLVRFRHNRPGSWRAKDCGGEWGGVEKRGGGRRRGCHEWKRLQCRLGCVTRQKIANYIKSQDAEYHSADLGVNVMSKNCLNKQQQQQQTMANASNLCEETD